MRIRFGMPNQSIYLIQIHTLLRIVSDFSAATEALLGQYNFTIFGICGFGGRAFGDLGMTRMEIVDWQWGFWGSAGSKTNPGFRVQHVLFKNKKQQCVFFKTPNERWL